MPANLENSAVDAGLERNMRFLGTSDVWKTQQWPQDWKKSVFIPIPKKGNAKE